MLKKLKKLLERLWQAVYHVVETQRTTEWSKLWVNRDDGQEIAETDLTTAQLALRISKRLEILIQPKLSRYEVDWIIEATAGDLEFLAERIELEKEQARELAVNAYKFLEEQHE